MTAMVAKKRPIRSIATPLLFMCGLCYLSYHAVSGERGALAYIQLSQKLEKTQSELDDMRAERINLERRVKAMRPESLDLDLLDEQARTVLGVAGPDEIVTMIDTKKESHQE